MMRRISIFLLALGFIFAPSPKHKADTLPAAFTAIAVKEVIDGDTIELVGGERVRYIGIDTPELRRKVGKAWVYSPQPLAEEAKDFNRHLVEKKKVKLEYDLEKRDKYNRLLAYVYVGDIFVNAEMLKAGYALTYTLPPNVKYVDLFFRMQREAMKNQRGLWENLDVEHRKTD